MNPQAVEGAGKLLDYGAIGLLALILLGVIIVLLRFTNNMHKEHKSERKEWRASDEAKHKEMLEAFDNNSTIISELSTLIKSRTY